MMGERSAGYVTDWETPVSSTCLRKYEKRNEEDIINTQGEYWTAEIDHKHTKCTEHEPLDWIFSLIGTN